MCVAAYGIFGDKDDGSKVSPSVKRQLLKTNRALRKGDYSQAEKASHKALSLLMNSEHTEKQAYLEARAVVMDKVLLMMSCLMNNVMFLACMHGYILHTGICACL